MTVIIGIDPHKASHTAVAIGGDEQKLAEIKVRGQLGPPILRGSSPQKHAFGYQL